MKRIDSDMQSNTPAINVSAQKKENWSYLSYQDDMGRGVVKEASTISSNTVSFDFPYEGSQHGTLTLRVHPQYGKDVMLDIRKGQFLAGIDGCKVLLRFDEGQPLTFWANEPNDHSSTMLFISGYSKIVPMLKRSKKLKIEAPFYQEGNRVFEFDVDGLKWE